MIVVFKCVFKQFVFDLFAYMTDDIGAEEVLQYGQNLVKIYMQWKLIKQDEIRRGLNEFRYK